MEIGVQFYTLRDHCKNLDDFAESLKKVADIGYKNVQISCVCDYEPEWLAEQLKKNGLKCVLTHTPVPQLTGGDLKTVCKNHEIFGCDYIGLGCFDFSDTAEGRTYDDFVKIYKPVAKEIKENGKRFMYHNHAKEFLRFGADNRIIERIMKDFDKDELGFVLDVFWVQAAGGDPAAWMEKLSGRIPTIHLKDYYFDPQAKNPCDHIAVVGEGNINFDRIFEKAETCGVKYMLVEQDECHGEDPFDCVKRSYNYLKSCGF